MSKSRKAQLVAFIAAAGATGAAGSAQAAVNFCVPSTPGSPLTSAAADGSCGSTAKAVRMPESAADQQTLIDILPFMQFKSVGVGAKPTITLRGVNVNLRRARDLYPSQDGTGNLVFGDAAHYGSATGHEGSENLIMGAMNRWSGDLNLLVGEAHTAKGTWNIVGGRQQTVEGSGNLTGGGFGNKITSSWGAVIGRESQTLNENYGAIADGVGKDVHWAKFDATGKFIGGSEQPEYTWGNGSQALVQFKGVDASKCTITVDAVQSEHGMEPIVGNHSLYYNAQYIYARTLKGTSLTPAAMNVIATCNQKVAG